MSALRPFFGYFGGKWRLTKRGFYPAPQYDTTVEPFAGAAGYSLNYAHKQVHLIEKNDAIAGIWAALISGKMPNLPDDAHAIPPGSWKDLAGMWLGKGLARPLRTPSHWMGDPRYSNALWWGARVRARIAEQMPNIAHWSITHASYADAPDIEATWFIDPPYQHAGRAYPTHDIDYSALAAWRKTRRGQVIVCEASGANWLPFAALPESKQRLSKRNAHREAMWTANQ